MTAIPDLPAASAVTGGTLLPISQPQPDGSHATFRGTVDQLAAYLQPILLAGAGGRELVSLAVLPSGQLQATFADTSTLALGAVVNGVAALSFASGHLFATLNSGTVLDAGVLPVAPLPASKQLLRTDAAGLPQGVTLTPGTLLYTAADGSVAGAAIGANLALANGTVAATGSTGGATLPPGAQLVGANSGGLPVQVSVGANLTLAAGTLSAPPPLSVPPAPLLGGAAGALVPITPPNNRLLFADGTGAIGGAVVGPYLSFNAGTLAGSPPTVLASGIGTALAVVNGTTAVNNTGVLSIGGDAHLGVTEAAGIVTLTNNGLVAAAGAGLTVTNGTVSATVGLNAIGANLTLAAGTLSAPAPVVLGSGAGIGLVVNAGTTAINNTGVLSVAGDAHLGVTTVNGVVSLTSKGVLDATNGLSLVAGTVGMSVPVTALGANLAAPGGVLDVKVPAGALLTGAGGTLAGLNPAANQLLATGTGGAVGGLAIGANLSVTGGTISASGGTSAAQPIVGGVGNSVTTVSGTVTVTSKSGIEAVGANLTLTAGTLSAPAPLSVPTASLLRGVGGALTGITLTPSTLFGADASGNGQSIVPGANVTLTAGTLSATGPVAVPSAPLLRGSAGSLAGIVLAPGALVGTDTLSGVNSWSLGSGLTMIVAGSVTSLAQSMPLVATTPAFTTAGGTLGLQLVAGPNVSITGGNTISAPAPGAFSGDASTANVIPAAQGTIAAGPGANLSTMHSMPYDVRLDGVVCDGLAATPTDNLAAVQRAIARTAAAGIKSIWMPGPVYVSDAGALTFAAGTTLSMRGGGALVYPARSLTSTLILSQGQLTGTPTVTSSDGRVCTPQMAMLPDNSGGANVTLVSATGNWTTSVATTIAGAATTTSTTIPLAVLQGATPANTSSLVGQVQVNHLPVVATGHAVAGQLALTISGGSTLGLTAGLSIGDASNPGFIGAGVTAASITNSTINYDATVTMSGTAVSTFTADKILLGGTTSVNGPVVVGGTTTTTINYIGTALSIATDVQRGNMSVVPNCAGGTLVTFAGQGSVSATMTGYVLNAVGASGTGTFTVGAPVLTMTGGGPVVQPIIAPICRAPKLAGVLLDMHGDQNVFPLYSGITGPIANNVVSVENFGADPNGLIATGSFAAGATVVNVGNINVTTGMTLASLTTPANIPAGCTVSKLSTVAGGNATIATLSLPTAGAGTADTLSFNGSKLSRMAFINALNSGAQEVHAKGTEYAIEDSLGSAPAGVALLGAGYETSTIVLKRGSIYSTAASPGTLQRGALGLGKAGCQIKNIKITCEQVDFAGMALTDLIQFPAGLYLDNAQSTTLEDVFVLNFVNGFAQFVEGGFLSCRNFRVSAYNYGTFWGQGAAAIKVHDINVGTHDMSANQVALAGSTQYGAVVAYSLVEFIGGIMLCPVQVYLPAGLPPPTILGTPPYPDCTFTGFQFDVGANAIQQQAGRLKFCNCDFQLSSSLQVDAIVHTGGIMNITGGRMNWLGGASGVAAAIKSIIPTGMVNAAMLIDGLQVQCFETDAFNKIKTRLYTSTGPVNFKFSGQVLPNPAVPHAGVNMFAFDSQVAAVDLDVQVTGQNSGVSTGNVVSLPVDVPGRISITAPGWSNALPASPTRLKVIAVST